MVSIPQKSTPSKQITIVAEPNDLYGLGKSKTTGQGLMRSTAVSFAHNDTSSQHTSVPSTPADDSLPHQSNYFIPNDLMKNSEAQMKLTQYLKSNIPQLNQMIEKGV